MFSMISRILFNYLKITVGDMINLLLAATAYNFKKGTQAIAEIFVLVFAIIRSLKIPSLTGPKRLRSVNCYF